MRLKLVPTVPLWKPVGKQGQVLRNTGLKGHKTGARYIAGHQCVASTAALDCKALCKPTSHTVHGCNADCSHRTCGSRGLARSYVLWPVQLEVIYAGNHGTAKKRLH